MDEEEPQDFAATEPGGGGEDAIILDVALAGLKRAAEGARREREIAEALQRELLSERLPVAAGFALAARYIAGTDEAQVGGDWYDAIPLRDGQLGLVIGDVAGRGVRAAARAGHLQSAVRAYALEGFGPALVIERMNRFVNELERGGLATLLYVLVDPEREEARITSAGHPPPLVIESQGETSFAAGGAGNPIGVVEFASYEETVIHLEPGSTLVLYTDGLVERPGLSLDRGLDSLGRAAHEQLADPAELCRALVESMLGGERPGDDVAILAAQLEAVDPSRLALELPSEPESLAVARQALSRWLRAAGAEEGEIYQTVVACGEACANAVEHPNPSGRPTFTLEVVRDGSEVIATVSDQGPWRDEGSRRRGRGLQVMRGLADAVDVESSSEGTTVRLRKRIAGAPA